jgi:poly(3-hydroxybutyrate) depolymerase
MLTVKDIRTQLRMRPRQRGLAVTIGVVIAAFLAAVLMTPGATAAAPPSALAATAGCGKAPTLASGTHTINSGGQNRTYILSVPSNYNNNTPYRLIFGQHWLNGTANDVATGGGDGAAWAFYGQKQLSNNSTIFVAAQGLDNGWANTGNRDLTLFDNLTTLMQNTFCIDTSLIFAMGWSYGGSMSYALACARPQVFRAVVVYSGANLSGCNGGTQPVAYFGIHGTFDSVLNISMGRQIRDTFVRANGCTSQSPPEPARGSGGHITTAYSGCRAGYPVQWAAFDGDHAPHPVDGGGTNGSRTWTSAEAWRFISQFTSTGTQPTTPPVDPTGSVPPTTTQPPGEPGACTATVTAGDSWSDRFNLNIAVSGASNWVVSLALNGGQTLQNSWNASVSGTSGTVTARPNGSSSFGVTIMANGNTTWPTVSCQAG